MLCLGTYLNLMTMKIGLDEDEERRNEQFLISTFFQVSNVFQLDASSKITGEEA